MQLFGQKGPTDKTLWFRKKWQAKILLLLKNNTFWGKHGFAVPVWKPTFHISKDTREAFSSLWISSRYREPKWVFCGSGKLRDHRPYTILHGLVPTTNAAQQVTLPRTYPKSVTSWLVAKTRSLAERLVMEEYWKMEEHRSRPEGCAERCQVLKNFQRARK